ncbi:MAG TPA: FAD-dependent oxidoreductase [Thermomicrobiaceae bacterium]|nr:FAD-dependent oxidoreductase [Thermomicrobiaceae bacterium]
MCGATSDLAAGPYRVPGVGPQPSRSDRAAIRQTAGRDGHVDQIALYGAPWCPDCRRSKAFLMEQRIPFTWVDIDADAAGLRFVEELQHGGRTIPTIVFPDGSHLLEPSNADLAEKLGLRLRAERMVYDVLILGGGPAGLSAAIYAAREGLEALVIERGALGGQAGTTDRIDNYPGFPEGIGGAELAGRLIAHARRYGVELLSAVEVTGIRREDGCVMVTTASGDTYGADAAIVATGSRYRRLGVPGEAGLIGLGVHYCATCDGPFYRGAQELVVIGGGNSALEESLFLATLADKVTILTRGELRASDLVKDAVRSNPRIEVHTGMDILDFERADGRLGAVLTRERATGRDRRFEPAAAFVFVGLDPNTQFLRGLVDLDDRGFVVTDDTYATSLGGVYAAGDVRAGATKQVGSAAGEGIAALLSIRRSLERDHLKAVTTMDEALVGAGTDRVARSSSRSGGVGR